jgi:hypothetical protein
VLSAGQSDLDAFMGGARPARRNRKKLQQHVLDERESIDLRGPGRVPIWGERRGIPGIRDGFFVRSPVKFNGVEIAIRTARVKELLEAPAARETPPARRAAGQAPVVPAEDTPRDVDGPLKQTRQPDSFHRVFLRFKFEEGKCARRARNARRP